MHEYVSMHVFILQKYDENCLASNYYYGLYRRGTCGTTQPGCTTAKI